MNKSIVISDFDDTIAFSEQAIAVASEAVTGKRMSRADVRAIKNHDVKSGIYELAKKEHGHLLVPNASAIDFIRAKKTEGSEVVILSAALTSMIEETRKKLAEYGVPYDRLVLREDPHSRDEDWKKDEVSKLARSHDTVFLLEDKAENLANMMSALPGKRVVCYLATEAGLKVFDPDTKA